MLFIGGGGVNMSELEYTLPYIEENYTGPYLSDGKFQESVSFGSVKPSSKLDALSRLHDTAYSKYQDFGHRTAADVLYNDEAQKLIAMFPHLAGDIVLYGNAAGRSISNLASTARFGLPGLIFGAVKNMYNLNDYMMNENKYKGDIKALYESDPIKFHEPSKLDYNPLLEKKSLLQPKLEKKILSARAQQEFFVRSLGINHDCNNCYFEYFHRKRRRRKRIYIS